MPLTEFESSLPCSQETETGLKYNTLVFSTMTPYSLVVTKKTVPDKQTNVAFAMV
jgi:hypothetical protein